MTNHNKGIVSSVLSPACRAWLRSQVSHVDRLEVDIAGGSRQILGGTIPRVAVAATGAIYQGLSLGSIDLIAENIRINLPQVLKSQPLRLLEPIIVQAEAKFSETDLQASLASPLLSQAITDLVTQILAADPHQADWRIDWYQLQIAPQTLILRGNVQIIAQAVAESFTGAAQPTEAAIEISMGIEIVDGHILNLDPLTIACAVDLPGSQINNYRIDLGCDVNITNFQLMAGESICQGWIQVNP